jgi:hypothetical protein
MVFAYLDPVGELHAGEGVTELVLDDGGAHIDQPSVGYHTKLLHLIYSNRMFNINRNIQVLICGTTRI